MHKKDNWQNSYYAFSYDLVAFNHSMHRRCWLGGKKGIRPEKKLSGWMLAWLFCLGRGADLHMAQLMPLPLTISCSSKSRLVLPLWFYLSGTGSPG